MKTLTNINLSDAFRFAANIAGRQTADMTLGDVADTFNEISSMVNAVLLNGAPKTTTVAAAPAAPAKKRGRPAGKKSDSPKAEKPVSKNKSGADRAPRGQRQQIVRDVVADAGGTMAFAAVAKAVIDREGATGDAAKILHNAVYALLNKMIEKGDATLASDDPKTVRIKGAGKQKAAESEVGIIEIDA